MYAYPYTKDAYRFANMVTKNNHVSTVDTTETE